MSIWRELSIYAIHRCFQALTELVVLWPFHKANGSAMSAAVKIFVINGSVYEYVFCPK